MNYPFFNRDGFSIVGDKFLNKNIGEIQTDNDLDLDITVEEISVKIKKSTIQIEDPKAILQEYSNDDTDELYGLKDISDAANDLVEDDEHNVDVPINKFNEINPENTNTKEFQNEGWGKKYTENSRKVQDQLGIKGQEVETDKRLITLLGKAEFKKLLKEKNPTQELTKLLNKHNNFDYTDTDHQKLLKKFVKKIKVKSISYEDIGNFMEAIDPLAKLKTEAFVEIFEIFLNKFSKYREYDKEELMKSCILNTLTSAYDKEPSIIDLIKEKNRKKYSPTWELAYKVLKKLGEI